MLLQTAAIVVVPLPVIVSDSVSRDLPCKVTFQLFSLKQVLVAHVQLQPPVKGQAPELLAKLNVKATV